MNTIRMNRFGSTLTDRADGKQAFRNICEGSPFPVELDFYRVVSLGSSFGEEVILNIAPLQDGKITILDTNGSMKNSVKRIIEGTSIQISFADPFLDQLKLAASKIERHSQISTKFIPDLKAPYFALHSISLPEIELPKDRLKETFLSTSKSYSESLFYAKAAKIHPDGYTRTYLERDEQDERVSTYAATVYFDGHVVEEGHIGQYIEEKRYFNPNWFLYRIQRNLQLAKEVFEGYASQLIFIVLFRNLDSIQWAIFRAEQLRKSNPYSGYHNQISRRVSIEEIHGRDKWNMKMQAAESILIEVARIFGMDALPQEYWDSKNVLDYPRGVSGR